MSIDSLPVLNRRHHQRLREMYRSSGWPCHDVLEVELLAAGMLSRHFDEFGREHLRLTDAGIALLAQVFAGNRAARSAHETLVEQVAHAMIAEGRLAWRGLMLRVPLPVSLFEDESDAEKQAASLAESMPLAQSEDAMLEPPPKQPGQVWVMAAPDVFSVRRTSVEAYLEPVVHEIKVSRADLMGDLKKPAKRAAYLAMAGACWYVIGCNAKGKPIANAEEIPSECGVKLFADGQLQVLREAPRRGVESLPFSTWMALAKSTPEARPDKRQQSF